jgi:hypothetical protein
MGNEMKTDQVAELLKDAAKLAKDSLKSTDPLVVIGVAQLLSEAQRREKKVLPGFPVAPSRPDPIQEARRKPRTPLLARTKDKAPPAKKTSRKR